MNSPSLAVRLWSKARLVDGCWIWTAARFRRGYGRFRIGQKYYQAHRIAFQLAHGSILTGLLVCHACDNPLCVNPAHLFSGTQSDNMRDMERKGRGRHPKGEAHGLSKLTAAQVAKLRKLREGGATYKELCARFGISKSTVSTIVNKKTWRE